MKCFEQVTKTDFKRLLIFEINQNISQIESVLTRENVKDMKNELKQSKVLFEKIKFMLEDKRKYLK